MKSENKTIIISRATNLWSNFGTDSTYSKNYKLNVIMNNYRVKYLKKKKNKIQNLKTL